MTPFSGRKSLTKRAASVSSLALLTALSIGPVTKAQDPTSDATSPPTKFATMRPTVEIRDKAGTLLYQPNAKPSYPLGALAPHLLAFLDGTNAANTAINLTIDARIQLIAEQALRTVHRGAAVVVDVRNGDVLAMASVPSFDPNTFPGDATARQLLADETAPLQNRALAALTPGSTFKVVTALAGLRKGLGTTQFNCSGGVQYGAKMLNCWASVAGLPPHGSLALDDALKVSCNPYFFQYGNRASIREIVGMGNLLGLGQKSGLPVVSEEAGLIPGPDWLRVTSPNERWSDGYTANVSIGQGAVQATPLQMAMVAATIANGGQSWVPRLRQDAEPRLRSELTKEGIDATQLEVVRRGMWKVVNETGGTAKAAQIPGLTIAGKTGTAQVMRNNEKEQVGWFMGFAPYEQPQLAICIMVQGAKSGGSVAAPIAGRIMDQSLKSKDTAELKPLEPAQGSFENTEAVSFK
jgi:penicillin-binding protein 2